LCNERIIKRCGSLRLTTCIRRPAPSIASVEKFSSIARGTSVALQVSELNKGAAMKNLTPKTTDVPAISENPGIDGERWRA